MTTTTGGAANVLNWLEEWVLQPFVCHTHQPL
jgi:hypothetical protein